MRLNDAIFNWLQIKVVAESRTNDQAAQETYQFFSEILQEDYGVEIEEVVQDETMYRVSYRQGEQQKKLMFDREAVDLLLTNIENEPKYNVNYSVSEE